MGLEGEGRQEEHQNGEEAAAGGLCWTEAQGFGSTARPRESREGGTAVSVGETNKTCRLGYLLFHL